MVYDRVHVDETSLDWNSSLLVPVVHADARRAGGCGARFDGDGDGGFCDVFDVVGVVPLETTDECLLGYVSKVEVVDGNYYVLDGQRKAVFVFDGQGTFLRRIGIVGHGHGEYERASDLYV